MPPATCLQVSSSCPCRQGSEKPGFFKKAQPGWVFWGFIGFYWVLGFIGVFGQAVPDMLPNKHGKGKRLTKDFIYLLIFIFYIYLGTYKAEKLVKAYCYVHRDTDKLYW